MPSENVKPVRLDLFMGQALERYYHNRDPLGADGDFTTAPEISQLFGEIIGIWVVQQWMQLGSPSPFNLIEIGPGRGTLMADLIRGTKHIPGFHGAMTVHLVETSPTLISKQQETLSDHNVTWHKDLKSFNAHNINILIANEFFDALPIRQFKRHETGWKELYISDHDMMWFDCEHPCLKPTLPSHKISDITEYSCDQEQYARQINDLCRAALVIDYGYSKSAYGDTLQALYNHKFCKITDHVGHADLTSHIDFEWLASMYSDKNTRISDQADFLLRNGIQYRLQQIQSPKIVSGYNRLINDMGQLFKVLEVSPKT